MARVVPGQLSLVDDVAWCRRCGRRLRSAAAVKVGFGRVCARRAREEKAERCKSQDGKY